MQHSSRVYTEIILFVIVLYVVCCIDEKGNDDGLPKIRIIKKCYKRTLKNEYNDNFWLYNVLLADCKVELICLQNFFEANVSDNHNLMMQFLRENTTFFLPIDKTWPETWLTADVLGIFRKYNVSSKQFNLVHISDETWPPHGPVSKFYEKWKTVFRNFWWEESRFRYLRNIGHLTWFPLGYLTAPRKLNFNIGNIIPSSKRIHNLTFVGNTYANYRRLIHFDEVKNATNMTIYGSIKKHGFRVGSSKDYLTAMQNSKLCLNFRGRMLECYRFYESLEMGCIPIIIETFPSFNYTFFSQQYNILKEDVPWRKYTSNWPFIWAYSLQEFVNIIFNLINDPIALDKMQRDSFEWWQNAKLFYRRKFKEKLCFYE